MRREISLLFLIASSLLLSACSTLTKITYYAPSHKMAVPDKQMAFLRCHQFSGPPVTQRIKFSNEELVIRVSSDQVAESQRTYSFGPAWLPVIPTLFNWFIPYKRVDADVEINVEFKKIKNEMEWDPYKSFVLVSEGVLVPPSKIKNRQGMELTSGEILPLADGRIVQLVFHLPKNLNEFTLFIEGVSTEGKQMPEIPIAFKYSKGWVMGFIP